MHINISAPWSARRRWAQCEKQGERRPRGSVPPDSTAVGVYASTANALTAQKWWSGCH